MTRTRVGALPALLAAAAIAGCGSAGAIPGDRIEGRRLTIYVSVPLQGDSRPDGQAILNAARLAVAQVHGRIGNYAIALRPLDDATPQRRSWDPGQTTANARLAVADRTAIGYIGEFSSGASAISIPILNRAGIPEISPTSTAVGLTSGAAGAAPGEPAKYYPSGRRSFARVVPNDAVQSSVQVRLQQRLGCRKTYVVDDEEVDGQDMADSFQLVARSAGLDVVGVQAFVRDARSYLSFAAGIAQSGADCVLISAVSDSGAAAVARELTAAMPRARFFGTAGIAQEAFTAPSLGGLPFEADRRFLLTVPDAAPLSDPAARAFAAVYSRRFGPPAPAAILGYEAAGLMLDAIARATGGGSDAARRSKVLQAIFDTRERASVLGTYSINSDGDTSIDRYGIYRIVDGGLRYWKAIDGS